MKEEFGAVKRRNEKTTARLPAKTGRRSLTQGEGRSVREDAPLGFREGIPVRRTSIDLGHRRIRVPEREERFDRGIPLPDESLRVAPDRVLRRRDRSREQGFAARQVLIRALLSRRGVTRTMFVSSGRGHPLLHCAGQRTMIGRDKPSRHRQQSDGNSEGTRCVHG